MSEQTPIDNKLSPAELVAKAVERKATSALHRVILYAAGAVAVGGAGTAANAHTRINDEHDQAVLTKQAVHVLEDAMRMESQERKADNERTNQKLDHIVELMFDRTDRDVSPPGSNPKGHP